MSNPDVLRDRRRFLARTSQLGLATMAAPLLLENIAAAGFVSSSSTRAVEETLNVEPREEFFGKKAVIVGAGIAGLSAGYLLKKAGMEVTVLEASDFVGGRMSSFELEGRVVDRGAQFYPEGFYSTLVPLVRELGLLDHRTTVSPKAGVVRDNIARTLCATALPTAFTGDLLKFSEVKLLKMGAGLIQVLAETCNVPVGDVSKWEFLDDATAAQWSLEHIGEIGTEYLSESILAGLSFHEPEEASQVLLFWILLFFLKGRTLRTFKQGMQAVPTALASRLDVKLNSPVLNLFRGERDFRVYTQEKEYQADYLIMATPSSVTKTLLQGASLSAAEARVLDASSYKRVLNIAVRTSRNWRDQERYRDLTFVVVPRKERGVVYSLTQDFRVSNQASGELFQVFCSPGPDSEMMGWSDDRLLEAITPDMERFFPGFRNSVSSLQVTRWESGVPYHDCGKSSRISEYRRHVEDSGTRMILAGDYLGFYGTDGAASTGLWAAERILDLALNRR